MIWGWVTATRTIDASATTLAMRFEVNSGTIVGYLSAPTFVMGPVRPQYYQPAKARYQLAEIFIPGNLSAGRDKARWRTLRPLIVRDVFLMARTAPATQAIIVDVNVFNGSSLVTMFSTRPQINAAGIAGSAQPDTTYSARCMTFRGAGAGEILQIDLDQVGSGTTGADLTIQIRYLTYDRPLEEFLSFADVN